MPDAPSIQDQFQGVRVLVTDDEPEMREVFSTWLRNLGCVVVEAADGAEALDELQQTKVDVVITDVRMPRLDGVSLAKRLVESLEYTPVVIFVSGFHDLPAAEAHDLGIEAILSKPCPRKQLIQAIQASLLRRNLQFLPSPSSAGAPRLMHRSFSDGWESSGVAIGRGGFSLLWESVVEPEGSVEYLLEFSSGQLRKLEGAGTVRWAEPTVGATRIGIEFTALADDSRRALLQLLQQTRPHSFIPRGCQSAYCAKSS